MGTPLIAGGMRSEWAICMAPRRLHAALAHRGLPTVARLSSLFTDSNTDCKAVKWDAAFEFESCEHGEYAV